MDEGIHCKIQTVKCLDCRELYDVYTRVHRREPPILTKPRFVEPPMVPPPVLVEKPVREFDGRPRTETDHPTYAWENVKLMCPRSKKHRVEAWRDPGRCPRCGVYLEKNGFPWRLWD
jgi:hypothetical protein